MERAGVKFSILFFFLLCAWSVERNHVAARGFIGVKLRSQEIDDEPAEYLQRNCRQEFSEIKRATVSSFPSNEAADDKYSSDVHLRRRRFHATLGILPPNLRQALLDCFSKREDSCETVSEIDCFTGYLELLWGQFDAPRRYLAEKILQLRAASTNSAPSLSAVPSPPSSHSPPPFSSSPPSQSPIAESPTNSLALSHILPSRAPSRSLQERARSPPPPSKQKKAASPPPTVKQKKATPSPPPVTSKKSLPPPAKSSVQSQESKASRSNEHQKSQADLIYVIGGVVAGSVALIMMVLLICLLRNSKAEYGDSQRDGRPLLTLSKGSSQTTDTEDYGSPTFIRNSLAKRNSHDTVLPGIPKGGSDACNNNDQLPPPKAPPATSGPNPPPPPAPKAPPPPPPKAGPRPPPPPVKGARPPPMPTHKVAGNRRGHSSSGEGSELTADSDAQRTKLKPFFWDKVLANPEQSMVWDDIRAGSFQFNEEMIESLFGYTNDKKNNDRRSWSSSDPSVSYIKIIDPKKSQNLSILLRALNVTTEEVRDALLEGNELPTELLQTLLRMAPTQDEELKLRLFNGDLSQLGPAERFLKVIVDIPFAFKRMDSLMFMMNMKEEVSGIKESFATLEVACNELKKSRLFLKLLEAVLKTGNRMNDGTYRGGAQAFKLDTLLKLSDVKGADGKITLLHFVVQEICRTEGIRAHRAAQENCSISAVSLKSDDFVEGANSEASENYRALGLQVVSGLSSELKNVKKAAIIDADALATTVSKLGQSLLKNKYFLNKEMQGMEEERFYHVLADFIEESEGEITRLLEEEKRIVELVKSTADYFHGNSGREEGLRLFVIIRDFLLMLDKICAQLKAQAARPAGPARMSSKDKVTTPRAQDAQPQAVEDMRRKLFPAISESRKDDSSSDDETST
ncbi:hypothetical protein Ancab_007967 [Ancistrocladus abbreviatus]